jgi:hypothetical protein
MLLSDHETQHVDLSPACCYSLISRIDRKMVRGKALQTLITDGMGFSRRKVVPTFQEGSDPSSVAAWMVTMTVALFLCVSIGITPVIAGPPFKTDDPEPVEYQHWQVYVASQYANDKNGVLSTFPHFEVDHGVLPNVDLHLLIPFGYDRPR